MSSFDDLLDEAFGKKRVKKTTYTRRAVEHIDKMVEPMEDQEEIILKHPIGMLRSIHYQLFGKEPPHDRAWTKKRIADKIIEELKK